MNMAIPTPNIGTRFSFHDSQFEISFIGHGICRYSALAGGRTFQIPYDQFENWYQSGLVEYDFNASNLLVDPQMTANMMRKLRYVKTALTELPYPTAIQALTFLIQKVANELQDQIPPHPRTVARWIQTYRLNHQRTEVLEKKKSGNHYVRFSLEIERLIHQAIQEVYLCAERRDGKDVLAFVVGKAMENGWGSHKIPCLRTIERRINRLDPYVVINAKKGSRTARKLLKAAGQSITSPAVMALVEIDTHYLDIIIIDDKTGAILGRPFLSCAIDIYTRVIVGIYISLYPPSALTTMCVIRDMITRPKRGLPGGVPSLIIPDNGVEFKNNSFARLCETLKITITPSQVGTPNNKPHIESFFRTLTEGLIQKLPGTTCSNPTARGDYNSSKNAKMTLADVQQYAERWINEIYHTHIHSETNRTPILAWEDVTKMVKLTSLADDEASVLCRKPYERSINKGRVLIDYLYYFSPALATLEQQKMIKVTVLVDEIDLGHVFIVDPNDPTNLIKAKCTNPDYAQGLTMYAHQEAQKIKKQMTQSDLRRLGENANLLARWQLLKKIQEDLQRKKPKLRQLVIDIPGEIKNLAMPYQAASSVVESHQEEQQVSTPYTAFSSMEI
ncbi:MAG: DDE-type integrase/transposase/recombinase [Acinetobacter populi]|jgi:transposase InsO family protein|uniref:Mu transposase C-terminal domain-containing protein n=1 Tax=Acinetobacter populi TaxID=1582270 RepID=UPI00235789FA|nr:Mu transposase C-terminal domain-containing protein [Acinetobacter populi]MCH4248515.1 DDE-type integrase/transposase/recombinase [Acinetobacter populi]